MLVGRGGPPRAPRLGRVPRTKQCYEAPSYEAAERVHREAHGLVADGLTEVREGG